MLHQFHDIIPGSSIREVYEDSTKAYKAVQQTVNTLCAKALQTLTTPAQNTYTVYHNGSFSREELVFIPENSPGATFTDETGAPLSLQQISCLPGAAAATPPAFSFGQNTLQTPFYTLEWNADGWLNRIYDKENDRNVLAAQGNLLEIYEDKPLNYDNWDIDIFHLQKKQIMQLSKPPQLVESGPLRAILRFTYTYNRSSIVQDVTVYAHSRRIDFATKADWHEENRLLKALFPVDIRATKASYDIQFGHVERPTHWNTSWDWARFEVVAHKWADVSETDYGVSLLNDCKYGYSIKNNEVRITLLKSTKHPDTEMDMGEHTFTYSLLPHTGNAATGNTIQEATALNLPAVSTPGALSRPGAQLITLNTAAVVVDAVKWAEDGDGLIVRLHECRGARHRVSLGSAYNLRAFAPCNLLEENLAQPTPVNRIFEIDIKPFEIKVFRLHIQ